MFNNYSIENLGVSVLEECRSLGCPAFIPLFRHEVEISDLGHISSRY